MRLRLERASPLFVCVVAAAVASCASPGPTHWAGQQQAQRLQIELRHCLAARGIDYRPTVHPPGSTRVVIEVPAPAAWWAIHGGYGLIEDQQAEVALDLVAQDPNHALTDTVAGQRQLDEALYGRGGSPISFSPAACYDRSLRAAGFLEESRAGTLPASSSLDPSRLLRLPRPRLAHHRFQRCMRRAGFGSAVASDPEGALRKQFLDNGTIRFDGRVGTVSTSQVERAEALERRTAVADVRCQTSSGLDRAIDVEVRRLARRP